MKEHIAFSLPETKFTVIPAAVIMDKNLSLEAKGLYCETFSYLKNSLFAGIKDFYLRKWENRPREIYKILYELEEAGYLKLKEVRDCCRNCSDIEYIFELRDEPEQNNISGKIEYKRCSY